MQGKIFYKESQKLPFFPDRFIINLYGILLIIATFISKICNFSIICKDKQKKIA